MSKKYIKKIITILTLIAITLVQIVPGTTVYNIAKAADFNGASGTSGDLKWNITAEGYLTIEGKGDYSKDHSVNWASSLLPEWLEYKEYIKSAEVDVQNITSMDYMFYSCASLGRLDLSKTDTSNVTDMSGMFEDCNNLKSLDISSFNTSNVTNMGGMFSGCRSLSSLDISSFNTSNVTNMGGMFSECRSLKSLDLSNFDTSNVTNMAYMFGVCNNLSSFDLSNFDTSNVTDMTYMFGFCNNLTSLDLSNFDTSNVTTMHSMFFRCSNLKNLNLSKFDTSNVTDMNSMFSECGSLTSLDLKNFDTSNVTDMRSMFLKCSNLTSLDLSSFRTKKVGYMRGMFNYCKSLISLDLSLFETENVLEMHGMFEGCTGLKVLDISSFILNLPKEESFRDKGVDFAGLSSLERLNFPANAHFSYDLPSLSGYYWVNDNNEVVTKTARDVAKKVTYTRIKGNGGSVPTPTPGSGDDVNTGIYADSSCVSLAAISARTLFVYGGNVKQPDGSRINYKSRVYYTNLQASNIVTVDKKGKSKVKKGKLVTGITSTSEKPALVKGKVSKDAAAVKVAKASISKGKVKVTAQKEPGSVYLWVMDTGDAGACICAKLTIKAAPSKLQIFAKASSDTNFSSDKKNLYKKDDIGIGNSVKLYVYPTYKENGQMKETKDASYSATVNRQMADYFTVTQDADNPYCFIVKANGLKNNKKTKGKITIQCNENGRKVVFAATAINSVQGISFTSVNGMADNTVSGSAVTSYVIGKSDTDKKTGNFSISINKNNSSFDTTDKVKLYAMGTADGFDKAMMEKGKVKVTSKLSGSQKKLTAKIGSDKKTVTVTAAKKIPAGTTIYYLVFYNNRQGKGYSIVEITAN